MRFTVDDVSPATAPLPTRPLGIGEALAIGGDPQTPVIEIGCHPLLAAVATAFADHRPLVLSPDAIWLTIAMGVAQHVRLNAERLRPRLVRHAGKQALQVALDGAMPTDAASWASALGAFRGQLAAHIGEGPARLYACDFSTSTDVELVASQIVLLDAYSPYFSLWMMCVCGIPTIEVTGTPADWRKIRERVDAIAELELESWARSLRPICDGLVAAAEGKPDRAFFQRIYKPIDAYGASVVTGWIARMFPYLKRGGVVSQPNPLLDLPFDEPRAPATARGFYTGPGLRTDDAPGGTSRITVRVSDRVAGELRNVALEGGLVGVTQRADGALAPIAGWSLAIAAPRMAEVAERIVAEHRAAPVVHPSRGGDAELVALYDRMDSAELFGGAWRIVPDREHRRVDIAGAARLHPTQFATLADGRSLWSAHVDGGSVYLLGRTSAPAPIIRERDGITRTPPVTALDAPAAIGVLGRSLATILDHALESGGDVDRLVVGRLDAMLRGH